ncbi:unnamed protein product [Prunus brigantina]
MQHGKVITYASRQLKKHELNYPTNDLELAAVVKSSGSVAHLRGKYLTLLVELRKSRVGLSLDDQGALLATLYNGTRTDYSVRNDGALMVGTQLYVLGDAALKREILEEAHCLAFAIHPGSTKMYRTLRVHYWWPFMEEIAEYVNKCLICQQVKAEQQKPSRLLQPLPILE